MGSGGQPQVASQRGKNPARKPQSTRAPRPGAGPRKAPNQPGAPSTKRAPAAPGTQKKDSLSPELHALATAIADALRLRHHGHRRSRGEWRARCLFHEERPGAKSLAFNEHKGTWQCFSARCGAKGNLAALGRALGVLENTTGQARATAASLRRRAQATHWRYASDLAVLEAVLDIAARANTVEPTASERQLAEGAGVTRPTAAAALRRLRLAGWLRRLKSGHGVNASSWRLHSPPDPCPQVKPLPATPVEDSSGLSCVHVPHANDAARFRALGHRAPRLLALLSTRPQKVSELAQAACLHRNRVAYWLKKAAALGVVVRLDTGQWTTGANATDTGLRAVAKACGTLGDGERQRELHAEQRLNYRARRHRRRLVLVPTASAATDAQNGARSDATEAGQGRTCTDTHAPPPALVLRAVASRSTPNQYREGEGDT